MTNQISVGGTQIPVEYIETLLQPKGWTAHADYDDIHFETESLSTQTLAMHALEVKIKRYMLGKVAAQETRRKLDAWNKGEPRRV